MPHGDADLGELIPRSVFYAQGRFGRLFPTLPPFAADTKLIRDALAELGVAGGPMDPGDDLSDPITLITDSAKSAHNPNNPHRNPAKWRLFIVRRAPEGLESRVRPSDRAVRVPEWSQLDGAIAQCNSAL